MAAIMKDSTIFGVVERATYLFKGQKKKLIKDFKREISKREFPRSSHNPGVHNVGKNGLPKMRLPFWR